MIIQWVTQAVRKGRTLLVTAALTLPAIYLPAQTSNTITFPRVRMPLSELFRQVERQTGNVVVVSSNAIDPH